MEITRFAIPGPVEITPRRLGDARGYFSEIYRADAFARFAPGFDFVQENQSLSAQVGTLRGLHYQTKPMAQGKLVRILAGAVFDVAVDGRHDSPTYGRWVSAELSADKGNQLWVPPGFAHGFCTLAPDTVVCYKVTAYYSPADDRGLAWDDTDLAIDWPMVDAQALSGKDRTQPKFADLPPLFSMQD